MPIHLFFSNHTEVLMDQFHELVHEQWIDPLNPPSVIIQNRLIEKWLKLEMAYRDGITAGLRGSYLEQWLWDIVAQPEEHMIKPEDLQLAIMDVFNDESDQTGLGDEVFEPLRNYLDTQDKAARARRSIQLSLRLATLFLEYQINRPLIVQNGEIVSYGWGILDENNKMYHPKLFSQHIRVKERKEQASNYEAWQTALFEKARPRLPENYYTLPEIWLKRWDLVAVAEQVKALQGQGPVLFGTSGLSLFHRHCLVQLADTRSWGASLDIPVFLLNPCAEFWEDVESDRERVRRKRREKKNKHAAKKVFEAKWETIAQSEPGELWGSDTDDNRLLQLWGQSGRDNIALWCQAAEYDIDFRAIEAEPVSKSVLHAVQDALLFRTTQIRCDYSADNSLSIMAIPGIRREVEAVREKILYLLANDSSVRLHEIAVFCPDPEKYRTAFYEIFSTVAPHEGHYIPFEFTEDTAGVSLFSAAIKDIFTLTDLQFTRAQVFSFLRNPLVQNAKGISSAQVEKWEKWADSLNVYRGWDVKWREWCGEVNPVRQHTWWRAIERLLLGNLVDEEVAVENADESDIDALVLPYLDFDSKDDDELIAFISTLEDLFESLRSFVEHNRENKRMLAEWTEDIKDLWDEWIVIPAQSSTLERDFAPESVVRTAFYDMLELFAKHPMGYNWEEVRLLIESHLQDELPGRISALGGKLMVCTLSEARPLPWKHVFVLGMQAGEFPPNEREDRLDLRWWKPIPGDSSHRRTMQYAFLELIHCVRESLTLSYQCEDLSSGAQLLPCSTLLELQSFINESVLKKNSSENALVKKVTLLAEEDNDPLVLLEEVKILKEAQNAKMLPEIEPLVCSNMKTSAKNNHSADWSTMRWFLLNPLECTLRKKLKLLNEDEKDALLVTDEPLSWDHLERFNIVKEWLSQLMSDSLSGNTISSFGKDELTSVMDMSWEKVLRQITIEGRGIEKVLGDISCEAIRSQLSLYQPPFLELFREFDHWNVDSNYFEVGKEGVLEGKTPLFIRYYKEDDEAIVICMPSELKIRHRVEGYLLALWRAMNGKKSTKVIYIAKDCKKPLKYVYDMEIDEAEEIVSSVLSGIHDDRCSFHMLPVEALEGLLDKTNCSCKDWSSSSIQKWIDNQLENSFTPEYRIRLDAMQLVRWQYPQNVEDLVLPRLKHLLFSSPEA
ncbi:exodeoxyribonuclease V subunit gamma [Chitinispirillales bacterium ANBcel5]|uniref:exodeoxyribonuclease V subunit gamma n=1 Tax=Cellulosispirillum alkaliphilum TaxID=3039283 RepID=UPI002A567076|nr:exodeoxyribonuclease V subunit gamma [Chitinispirillales bacterium ANBcel5]